MIEDTSFSRGDRFSDFVGAQVEQRRYTSASEVVRAGLRLFEEQETTLAALIDDENSGLSTPCKRREASPTV